MKKIVLFAANGFIGKSIIEYTKAYQKEYQITAVSRKPIAQLPEGFKRVLWDGKTIGPWAKELEGADLVINLAGKSVNCRYTAKNKSEIFASRLDSTRIIGEALEGCIIKPLCWMNVASATIYEHSLENPNTEEKGIIGKGFSVNVCKAWEKAFFVFKDLPTRQILLRSTIVLGKNGGVYPVLKKLARLGLGGKMGPGNQMVSWIHIQDFCKALFFIAEKEQTASIYNLGTPHPVQNRMFQKELRESLGIPYFIHQPVWMLKIGAAFIRTETELILKSRYIFPENLVSENFQFEFSEIRACLKDLNH